MPLYEFECQDCHRTSEILVRSTRWQGTPCPHCGSVKLSKNLSVFAPSASSSGTASAAPSSAAPACGRAGGCGCHGPRHRH